MVLATITRDTGWEEQNSYQGLLKEIDEFIKNDEWHYIYVFL